MRISDSGWQRLIDRAILLDLSLHKGITITLDDINMEEFNALTVLWQEQDKHQREELDAAQRRQKEALNHHGDPIPARYKTRPV